MYATRQAAAAVLAVVLAVPLIATQGLAPLNARSSAAVPAAGQSVSGEAHVVDGDTIVVGEVRVRLEGIDAPETSQTCNSGMFGRWACGREATGQLARLVRDRTVTCVSRGADKYGRMLGVCATAGLELNAALVRTGMAWAFVRYSNQYTGEEAVARRLKLGIWQGETMPAWDYRANRWKLAETQSQAEAPAGCVIKGNITRHGRIYHMPWSHWYGRTRIEPERGERWFCNEAEAIAAGWRSAAAN